MDSKLVLWKLPLPVDATGRTTGTHVFLVPADGPEYGGEGDAVDARWLPDHVLAIGDAPLSAPTQCRGTLQSKTRIGV